MNPARHGARDGALPDDVEPGGLGGDAGPDRAALRRLRHLCIAIAAVAVAEFLIATPGVQIRRLPASTDFATYYLAGVLAAEHRSPYDAEALAARGRARGFTYDQFPFLYPPPFALAMQPLAGLSYPRARQVWMLLSTAALLAALAAVHTLGRRHAEALGIRSAPHVWIVLAAFVPAALNSTGVHNDLRAGSVGCLLLGALAVVGAAMVAEDAPVPGRRPWRCDAALAAALAVATLVKLVPVVLVAWVAWRGRRRAAAFALGLLAASMLPALFHWGPGIVADFVRQGLVPGLRHDLSSPLNQSLDGWLARVFGPSSWVTPPVAAPSAGVALALVLGAAIVVVTLRTLGAQDRDRAALPVELGCVVLALLAVMKYAWVHTLTAMLFVWPVLLLAILHAAERGAPWARRASMTAAAGLFLAAAHLPILWSGAQSGPAVVLTGAHLAGVLLLWGTSVWVLRHWPGGDAARAA